MIHYIVRVLNHGNTSGCYTCIMLDCHKEVLWNNNSSNGLYKFYWCVGSLTVDKMEVSSIGSVGPGSPSLLSSTSSSGGGGGGHGDQVVESLAPGLDPEEDSNHYMAILIESLSILGRVQDALDVRILYICNS